MALLAVSASADWEPDCRLSTTDSAVTMNENMARCLVTCGDTLHVVWCDLQNHGSAIYYKRSTDQGTTWTADTGLSGYPATAGFPTLALSGTTLHLAFRDQRSGQYGAYYKRSLDGGQTWGADVAIGETLIYNWWPAIAAVDSFVYVALNEDSGGNSEVYFRRSTDNGATWQGIQRMSNAPLRSEDPCIAADGPCVHIVWNEFRHGGNGHSEVYYRRSSDQGVTWGPETRLTYDTAMSYSPTVFPSDSNVDVAWEDNRNGSFNIYHKRSCDYGLTWGPDERITRDTFSSFYPSIVTAGQDIHMVWSGGGLYYLHSADGGASWDSIVRLVSSASSPGSAFIALSGPAVHVVWVDRRDGLGAVYYKRNLTGNLAEAEPLEPIACFDQRAALIVRGVLRLPDAVGGRRSAVSALLDISGRKLLDLHPGANDISRLAPGVYFMSSAADGRRPRVKVVVQH
jgi:hypothetical protein